VVPKPVVKPAPPSLQSTLVFLGVVLYLGTTVFRLGVQEFHLLKQARLLEGERVAIAAQHQDLRSQIASTRTNAGIERLAREQLGFVMAQEIPVKTLTPVPSGGVTLPPAIVAAAPVAQPAAAVPPSAEAGLPPAMAALSKFFVPLWK
jgi:cell division protein FtsB